MENQRLTYLLGQYAHDLATPAERAELEQYLQSDASEEALPLLMADEMQQHRDPQFDVSPYTQLSARVLEIDKGSFAHMPEVDKGGIPGVRSLYRRFAAAAAILVLIAIGGYRWMQNRQPAVIMQHNVIPGGNKATLTLGDGTIIQLEEAGNGTVAKQGGSQVVKCANGQLAYHSSTGGVVFFNTMRTPRGGQYQLDLPDGTKAWLNAASSITFPTAFAGKERKVKIEGEVYFEVAAVAAQPFIVEARNSTVQVLGTQFNINSYADEAQTRTTLVQGKVKVTAGDAVVLKPGQQAIAVPHEKIIVTDTDVNSETAWKNGMFEFNENDIKTIMRQISRWYDVEVVYNDPPLDKLFMGRISREAPVTKVLELLELTQQIHFKIEGSKIIVSK